MIDLEKRKKLLDVILDITGGEVAAFYNIKDRIPSLKDISWKQVQQYKASLETHEIKERKAKILYFPRKNNHI